MAAVGREAMSDEQSDGFLGRWSRRKVQARTGQPLAEPSVPPVAAVPAPAPVVDELEVFESNRPPALADNAQAAINSEAKEPAPAPTLDDVKALTIDSDFQPFVARSVAPEVRNAAFKKLFADPHFNVMDGLDIYIDDYSRPDPLPLAMLRQMASAQFLGMVQEEPAPQQAAGSVPAGASKDPVAACAAPAHSVPPPADVAQSQPLTTSGAPVPAGFLPEGGPLASAAPHDHAHADLRLQPDHAPPAPGAGGAAP